jgi:hypothetical protein
MSWSRGAASMRIAHTGDWNQNRIQLSLLWGLLRNMNDEALNIKCCCIDNIVIIVIIVNAIIINNMIYYYYY